MDKPYQSTHWNYFLALEQDLMGASRFVEFSEANYETYSIEFAHILLAAASETDVLLKQICRLIEPNRDVSNIKGYREVIAEKNEQFFQQGAVIQRHGISLKPWSNWPEGGGPEWWASFNKVKHRRSEHFNEANLFNTIQAVAGLLITNLELMLQQSRAYERTLEKPIPNEMRDIVHGLHEQSRLFKLDDPWVYMHE